MFGIADYGAFCAAVLLFLALPGPGTFALLTATGLGGPRGGAAASTGLILGDQVLLWLAVAGVAALLAAHPAWFKALQWAGAAYLVWIGLGLLLARAPQGARAAGPGGAGGMLQIRPGGHGRQAFLITLLNPKAIVFYMAFFPLFVDPARHQGLVTFGAMALTIAVLSALYCALLITFAQALRVRVQAHRRLAAALQRGAGAVLVAFGVRMGLS
jgi:threonine/homoserine/homoserine lactone efflux protein